MNWDKESIDELSYDDFLALLYIYSASVDLDLSSDEKKSIINKVGNESYEKSFQLFKQLKDIEVTDLLFKLGHKFILTEEDKELVIKDINNIIHTNGRHSRVEEDVLLFIKKLI